jgi:pyruvate-formate lyase-activating enzyme
MSRFQIYLIKSTRYDDDGYPLQWWRSLVPSNSLACVAGIVDDALERGVIGGRSAADVHVIDEIHTSIIPARIIDDIRAAGGRGVILLVGVQSNQFPRALDHARAFRAAGLPVCIGGFHVSGCMAMLKDMPPDLKEAQSLGISFFLGEAEDQRIDRVLEDAAANALVPIYDHLKHTPSLAGAPIPLLSPDEIAKDLNRYASFDLGRGCPFECSFCTIINVQGRKSRFRTADDLERIVRANAANGINRFFLTDDNFARNRNWEEFADRLIALRKQGLRVRLAIQVDTLTHRIPRFIEKCAWAGADQIFIGLENINADNLEAVKKRQNRIEEYREMFMAWKKYRAVITCGYIIGFPNDTYASIMRDIEILKEELPIDTIYLNYLTPLPGSEDHRRLHEAGTWMDPDMNKYDLSHRVTHHPRMSDAEWEAAFHDAHRSFFSYDHMERILRRLVALKSNKRNTTIHRLIAYRECYRLENVAKLESGYIRIKRRRQRRPGLPLESPLVFYPRYALHVARVMTGLVTTYARLRFKLWRIMRDPKRLEYRDRAIMPATAAADDVSRLMTETRATDYSKRRKERLNLAS